MPAGERCVLSHWSTDFRTTLRGQLRSPLHAAAVVLTLGVALGGLAAVFAMVDAVMLRGLPYPQSERLVAVWTDVSARADEMGLQDPRREWTNFDDYTDLRNGAGSLQGIAAFTGWSPTLSGEGEAERLAGALPTWNAFEVLGVQPLLGRSFLPQEGEAGGEPVVVLGHGLWQRRFGGDPGVLGRSLQLNGTAFTVVGVMPAGFRFPFLPDAQVFAVNPYSSGDRGSFYLRLFARLQPDASLQQARAELDALAANLQERHPDTNRAQGLFVEPLRDALSIAVRPQILALQLAAWMVLLIAAANLASLMSARGRAREAEFALRASLGGGTGRQFRLLFGEALLLSALGAMLGLALAHLGLGVLAALFPQGFAELWDVRLGWSVVSLGMGVAVAVALILSLAGHWSLHSTVRNPAGLGSQARVTGSRRGGRLAAALVAINFALALAVSVGSLQLLDSHQRLQQVELGYRAEGLLSGNILLPAGSFADAAALTSAYQRLREALSGIPGVTAVGFSSSLPLGQNNADTTVMIEGARTARPDGRAHVWVNRASHDFLPTLEVRLREGRELRETDAGEAGRAALVNAAFVREYFAGQSPLGRRMNFGSEQEPMWFDIVGVVDDVRFFDVSVAQTPSVYPALTALPSRGIYLSIRTSGDVPSMVAPLRAALHRVDPMLALSDLRPMSERVDAALALPRAVGRIAMLFAACGLLLAGIGVYATLSHSVLRRIREFGVRRALGANHTAVLRQVASITLRPMLAGLVMGLPLAWLFGAQLKGVLYQVAPWSPQAWLGALLLLCLVGSVATLLPGRRALRVAPMVALRHE